MRWELPLVSLPFNSFSFSFNFALLDFNVSAPLYDDIMRSSTAATTNDSMYYTSASPPTQGRSKRWATHSVDEQLSGDEEQEEQDIDDEPKPRSKRARASNASNHSSTSSRGAASGGTAKGSTSAGGSSSAQGPVSANDKEQRKQARMIRNRSEFKSSLSPYIETTHAKRTSPAHHHALCSRFAQMPLKRRGIARRSTPSTWNLV